MNIDLVSGKPLPPNAIQRVLFIAPKVHIYQIPPLASTKGYQASTWTTDSKRQIFTGRVRILETSIPNPDTDSETVTAALLLEDPTTAQLFAAAPYTSPNVVEQALDSSRFFAITVVGEGRKAVLGMGFEERSDAFDFSIALQDLRRVLGMEVAGQGAKKPGEKKKEVEDVKRDFSLKEGETITVNLGGRGRRARPEESPSSKQSEHEALFSIKPPPGPGGNVGSAMPFLPPPPSAKSVKEERRRSRQTFEQKPQDFGFDDGEFGEFQ
jgi:hypothetical protein